MNSTQSKLANRLVGMVCSNFKIVEGGTLIIYLARAADEPRTATLWLDCAWRIVDSTSFLLGSMDDAKSIVNNLQWLPGKSVISATVAPITRDLRIGLLDGYMIEGFCHSSQIELWEFRGSDGYRLGVREDLEEYETVVPADGREAT